MLSLFDGKVCSKCGLWKALEEYHSDRSRPDGRKTACKPCKIIAADEWKQRNRERWQAYQDKYAAEHREQKRQNAVLWGKQHRVRKLVYMYEYRKRRNAYLNALRRASYRADKDGYKAKAREWARRNPDRRRAITDRYVARRKGAGGSYTVEQWSALCLWFGGQCLGCGRKTKLEVDHVVPLTHGGSNDITNLQPLCRSCNASKNAKDTDYRDPVRFAAFLATLH